MATSVARVAAPRPRQGAAGPSLKPVVRAVPRLREVTRLPPLLKWAGGKRWLVPALVELYEPHRDRVYCEPFAGGLGAAFGLRPAQAYLSDVSPWLVNLYTHVKRGLKCDPALTNTEDCYYASRERFNALSTGTGRNTAEAAQLFLYMNRTGYNGLCRFNKRGQFNTPYGHYKQVNYATDLSAYRVLMRDWRIECHAFDHVSYSDEWFLYADPPYPETYNSYAGNAFSWEEHERLAAMLGARKGPTVVSNSADRHVTNLYRKHGFRITLVDAPRSISCKADGRKGIKEMLATKGL